MKTVTPLLEASVPVPSFPPTVLVAPVPAVVVVVVVCKDTMVAELLVWDVVVGVRVSALERKIGG